MNTDIEVMHSEVFEAKISIKKISVKKFLGYLQHTPWIKAYSCFVKDESGDKYTLKTIHVK